MVTNSKSCKQVGLFFILWPGESEVECNNSHFLPSKSHSQVADEYEEGDIACLGILTWNCSIFYSCVAVLCFCVETMRNSVILEITTLNGNKFLEIMSKDKEDF